MYLDEGEEIKLLKTSLSAEGTNPTDQSQSDQLQVINPADQTQAIKSRRHSVSREATEKR